MGLTVHDLPPTAENMERCTLLGEVRLDNDSRRRKQRRHVKLRQDKAGYFIVDRFRERRNIIAVRVLAIDGQLLECGTAVLEREDV